MYCILTYIVLLSFSFFNSLFSTRLRLSQLNNKNISFNI